MRSKLLTVAIGAALSVTSLVAIATPAQDASTDASSTQVHTKLHKKTVRHTVAAGGSQVSDTHAADKQEIELLKAQLAQLQQQVSALQERTDAQSDINVSTGQNVEAVQKQVAVDDKYVADAKAGKIDFKGITITPGGFVEAATINRQKDLGADMASSYAIPYPNTATTHTHEQRFSARQSRLSLLAQGDISPDVHVAGYYEMDFLGAAPTANQNQSNSFTPRTRVVYATLDWDTYGLHLLGGDSWSLLTLNSKGITPRTEVLPPSIDAQYIPGFAWSRQPGIRIVKDWNKTFWLGLSLENPQTTFSGTAPSGTTYNQAGGSGYYSGNNISLNSMPDIILKAALDPGWGHYEVFGLSRQFTDRYAKANHNVHGGGVGLGVLLPLVDKFLDFQFSGMTGKGIGRYGTSGLGDVTFKPSGETSPIKETMMLAGFTLHPTSDLDVYLFGGQERQKKDDFYDAEGNPYGWGNPLVNNSGCNTEGASSSLCGANTRKISQATLGFWWRFYQGKFGKVQFGAQYSHTKRDIFEGIGGAPSVSDNMLFTSLRYYPF